MSSQSRTVSLIEQILNVGSGFIISLIVWITIIVPVFDIEMSMTNNLLVTSIFTVVSVIRGYFWRRLFNTNKFAVWIEGKIS